MGHYHFSGCAMTGFPSLEHLSYTTVREYFDSVKPWRSKYNLYNERPIGTRSVKLMDYPERFNKAMRMLDDDSIAFRLYDTDCVIWHPDGTLTINGYASMSTNDFIGRLTPRGVSHALGRKDCDEPVLHLYEGPYWWSNKGEDHMVVRSDGGVTLNYNVAQKRWLPTCPDDLLPFDVPVIVRKRAREVSRKYNLPRFEELARQDFTMALIPDACGTTNDSTHWANMCDSTRWANMCDCLAEGDLHKALSYCRRGQKENPYGYRKYWGTEFGVYPGFLRGFRDWLYDSEGAIVRERQHVLTLSQYNRFKQMEKRFG